MGNNKYLLDTHIFIWAMERNRRLPAKLIQLLQNPQNSIFVSIASIWEMMIKKTDRKLKITRDIEADIKLAGFQQLPIVLSHVLKIGNLPLHHKDPFDRLLIAQSSVEKLTLISADHNIWRYKINLLKA